MKINDNIIAHRGVYDNKNVPENSLAAIKLALNHNYPIELDIQLTKDNKLVVFHDFTLNRMTNRDESIQDLNYKEIKELRLLETNEHIPTLKEVLSTINEKVLIDIEIKNTKRIKETCDILAKEINNYKNVIIKSFNPRIVKYLKDNYPNLEVGLLLTDNNHNRFYNKTITHKFIIKYCNPDFLAISKNLLNNNKFMRISNSIPILVWTIDNKNEILDNNYTYICNNLPFN